MFEDQHTPPTRPVTPTPQRRLRSLAAACLAGAAFVLLSGAAPAATAAPAASTATPVWTTGPPPGGVPGVAVPTIRWSDAGDGYQQAYAAVPYDYARPRGKTFRLKLVRLPAADPAHRIGSLFINFGGPGAPAAVTSSPDRQVPAPRAGAGPLRPGGRRPTPHRAEPSASLMFAAYYAVIAAILVIHDEPTTLGGGPPAGVAAYLVVIGQFSFPGQLILLFAVIVLAGSMMLSAPVPPTADRTASYPAWPGWTSRLHRAQLLLAAVAGLLAVAYLVSGVLGLLVGRSVTGDQGPPPLILSSASVAALAFGVATLGVLAALMPWRTGGTPSAMGSGDDSDSVASDPALEISVVDAPSTPGASGDVIEGGPALRSTRQ